LEKAAFWLDLEPVRPAPSRPRRRDALPSFFSPAFTPLVGVWDEASTPREPSLGLEDEEE
jgi:hypothetical protein